MGSLLMWMTDNISVQPKLKQKPKSVITMENMGSYNIKETYNNEKYKYESKQVGSTDIA